MPLKYLSSTTLDHLFYFKRYDGSTERVLNAVPFQASLYPVDGNL